MTPALELLYASQDLSSEQTEELFTKIFNGETDPAVFASILTALKMKGEAPSEIAGAARAMVRAARHFPRPEGIEIGEIVGTANNQSTFQPLPRSVPRPTAYSSQNTAIVPFRRKPAPQIC